MDEPRRPKLKRKVDLPTHVHRDPKHPSQGQEDVTGYTSRPPLPSPAISHELLLALNCPLSRHQANLLYCRALVSLSFTLSHSLTHSLTNTPQQ